MKKLFYFVLGIIAIMTITSAKAQKVLVTDNAAFTTPATLLQVHKTASGDMLQLTNGLTGTTATDGFMISQDASSNVILNNQENANLQFRTNTATHMTIDAAGNVQMTGLLTYNFVHGACYVESISYTPDVTQNLYTQIVPSPAMTVSEQKGLTISNSTITIGITGDYKIDIVLTLTCSAVSDDFRVKMYKNGSAVGIPGSNHISPGGSNQYAVLPYFWYVPLSAGDVLTFWITNTQSNNDPTISDMKIYLEKKPE
jgi:hypothetical protein